MGNQQLLLIVVGVIIVITAVFVGIRLFSVSYDDQIKDLAIHKAHDIGLRANVYRKKTIAQGGGGGSYIGFDRELSEQLKKDDVVDKFKLNVKKNRITMRFVLHIKGENNRRYKIWAKYVSDGLDKLRVYEPDKKKWVWLYKRKK